MNNQGKSSDPFYKSGKWKHLRKVILQRDGFMCQVSKRYGKHIQADTVHHIFPRDEFPEYRYQSWNLISICNEVHNRLHDRVTNALTADGIDLLRRTAQSKGIEVPAQYADVTRIERDAVVKSAERILVCGYPGSGKSTWARNHLGDGIAYDLDAIAAAFRLRGPHEEQHDPSRRMANDLLYGFIQNAGEYSNKIIIIRTAPGMDELEDISPTKVIIRLKQYVDRPEGFNTEARLQNVAQWCEDRNIPVLYE